MRDDTVNHWFVDRVLLLAMHILSFS